MINFISDLVRAEDIVLVTREIALLNFEEIPSRDEVRNRFVQMMEAEGVQIPDPDLAINLFLDISVRDVWDTSFLHMALEIATISNLQKELALEIQLLLVKYSNRNTQ